MDTPRVIVFSAESRCETFLCHDIVRSAGAYSTLAGVLAGVAFLAIVFLLESQHFQEITRLIRPHNPERTRSQARLELGVGNVTVSLMAAFLNMIIATFLYAALSGEDLLGPRAETLGFIAAISLSVGFLILLYGIVWLLETRELALPAVVARTIAALVAPAVTFAFIAIRALDMRAVAEGHRAIRSWIGVFLLCLIGTMIALFTVSARLPKTEAIHTLTSQRVVRLTAYAALTIGILTVVATAVVSQLSVSYAIPRWGVAAVMTALFLTFCAYIILVGAVRHLEADALPRPRMPLAQP